MAWFKEDKGFGKTLHVHLRAHMGTCDPVINDGENSSDATPILSPLPGYAGTSPLPHPDPWDRQCRVPCCRGPSGSRDWRPSTPGHPHPPGPPALAPTYRRGGPPPNAPPEAPFLCNQSCSCVACSAETTKSTGGCELRRHRASSFASKAFVVSEPRLLIHGPRRVTMETATASNVVGGQGGRQEETPHQNAPTKGERILHLENECNRLAYVVDTLEDKVENLKAENVDLNRRLNESRDAWISMRGTVAGDTQRAIEKLETQVALLQQAIVNRGPGGRIENVGAGGGSKKRIPEPQLYSAVRNAKEVDNFLFDMEQYFLAADIEDEAERIATATMYLTGDAKQWWLGKYQDIRDRRERLDTWDLLQAAI
ncbi:hypothetical protein C2S51_032482 [Perilla frutescens var. frutescens]|nr:hypothetical protein C2S51_032482 [Perilla frutescens var. frutescens]